jgi:hypothetical protein
VIDEKQPILRPLLLMWIGDSMTPKVFGIGVKKKKMIGLNIILQIIRKFIKIQVIKESYCRTVCIYVRGGNFNWRKMNILGIARLVIQKTFPEGLQKAGYP